MIKIEEMLQKVFGTLSDDEKKNANAIKIPGGYTFNAETYKPANMKKGGIVSASKRADGCAIRGKTRGKIV